MYMLAVMLPLLCLAVPLRTAELRESFLESALVTGCFVAFSTELLSLFHALGYPQLVLAWAAFLVALVARRVAGRQREKPVPPPPEKATPFQKVLLALVLCLVCLTGVTAVVAAPNNFDSLTYHLPRIMHWIQNGSVAHYPTHIDRQLVLAPFSEFFMLHLYLLAGGDRFVNCVQWFALAGSAAGVSLIARALGGSLNGQIVSALLAVSVPMGLLQSTSTQNDYVAAFWLVCLAYYIFKPGDGRWIRQALPVGASLGLAILTKGTAYLFAFPFMLAYAWRLVAGEGWRRACLGLSTVALAILVLNGGHYARNLQLYGNPISPGTGNNIISERMGPAAVVSGITKNLATQLTTGVPAADRGLGELTATVHRLLGVDLHDPALNLDGRFAILPARFHEDTAPNPAHMVLLLAAAAALVAGRRGYARQTRLFGAATLLSFVVLSAGIKWNPFVSRYFLPVFVVSAPLVALAFDRKKLLPLVNACALLLIAFSFLVLARNEMRPLVGPRSVFVTDRLDQYFMARPQAKPYFLATAGMVRGQPLHNVGILDRDGNMWEYMLWVLLKDGGYRIEHVEVENASGAIRLEDFSPYFPVRI